MRHPATGFIRTAVVFVVSLLYLGGSSFAEVALAQVEIRLERMSGGGCSHCGGFSRIYDVVIRGDTIGDLRSLGVSTPVRSPFDGFLVAILASEGERLRPGQPVAWLRVR